MLMSGQVHEIQKEEMQTMKTKVKKKKEHEDKG